MGVEMEEMGRHYLALEIMVSTLAVGAGAVLHY